MEYGAFATVEEVYNKALAYSTPFGHAWYVFWGQFWYNKYFYWSRTIFYQSLIIMI